MRRVESSGRRALWLVLVASSGATSVAAAAPGDHVRTGNAEIIPYAELLGAYRSNVYLQEGTVGGGEPVRSGAYLSLSPGVIMNIGGEDATFRLDGEYNLRKYLDPELSNLDRYRDLHLGVDLNLLPKSTVGVRLNDELRITGRESEAVNASDAYVQQLNNVAMGRVYIRPGSSMEFGLGGDLEYQDYNVPPSLNLQNIANLNSKLSYGPALSYRWKFLPKTAVVSDFSMRWFDWDDNFIDTRDASDAENISEVGTGLGIADGRSWRASAGLRGRFTSKLVLGVVAGYGQLIYDEQTVVEDAANELVGDAIEADPSQGFGADLKGFPQGLILTADARYEASEDQTLTFGYVKDFEDVFFTNYVAYSYFYGRYEGIFADRVGTTAEVGMRLEGYEGEVSRDDNLIRMRFDLSYFATSYLDLTGGVWWIRRVSASGDPSIEYDDTNIHIGATFTY